MRPVPTPIAIQSYPRYVIQEEIDDGLVPEWITKPGVYLLP